MKRLVVYDSQFGNTKKIAEAIGEVLEETARVHIMRFSDVQLGDLMGIGLLVIGSPTQQFSATAGLKRWLNALPRDVLENVRSAAFDTRFTEEKINEIKVLGFFVNVFGYGAKPIARRLEKKGATLVVPPEGFYVADTEGPLLEKEIERAKEWAKKIIAS